MSDLKAYICKRRAKDAAFDEGFEEGYKAFRIGALLKQIREESGLTQAEMAERLHTKKSAISRIEQIRIEKILEKIGDRPRLKATLPNECFERDAANSAALLKQTLGPTTHAARVESCHAPLP